MNFEKVDILGVNIFSGGWCSFIDICNEVLNSSNKSSLIVSATSVHGVIEAQTDEVYKRILNNSFIAHPDGRPLMFFGKMAGDKKIEQIKGPEVLPEICKLTAKRNINHFFYGGKEGVAEDLAGRMQKRYSGLRVSGYYCPPFRDLTYKEKKDIITQINETGTDIVWVGLSTPKQEKWAYEFRKKLNVKLIFTVGAAFDFHTDNLELAPEWATKLYIEWLYRLVKEPKRLWKRYFRIVPMFLYLALKQIIKEKISNAKRR